MDKALTYHAGSQALNLDTTKDFRAPILLGTPATRTLSFAGHAIMCSSVNTCHRGG